MKRVDDALYTLVMACKLPQPSKDDEFIALKAYRTLMEESLPEQWQVPDGLREEELRAWAALRAEAWGLLVKALRFDMGRLEREMPQWAKCPICNSRLSPLIECDVEMEEEQLIFRYRVREAVCKKGHRFSIADLPEEFRMAAEDCVDAMAEFAERRFREMSEHLENLSKEDSEKPVVENKWVVEWQPKFELVFYAKNESGAREKAAYELSFELQDLANQLAYGRLPDDATVRPATEEDVRKLPLSEGDAR